MLWISVALSALFALLSVTHSQVEPNASCITHTNELGKCVPLRTCDHLIEIVNLAHRTQTKISAENERLLRQSHCGTFSNGPHVCCATNTPIQWNAAGKRLLDNVMCGQFDTGRIANGEQAALFSFPWMTLLKYNEGKMFRCGGSLISERYVLTAAHCVVGLEDTLTEVRLGEHDISTTEDCAIRGRRKICAPPVEDVGIERIIPHSGYQPGQIHHDIALLRLSRSVDIKQRHIKAICLPLPEKLRQKKHDGYIVSGWGNTENFTTSDVLLYTTVPTRELNECQRAFKLVGGLTTGHICAGGENLKDSCKGDSGGPLSQIDLFDGKYRLVQFGVVSLGIASCGQRNYPGIYSNVTYYLPWITDNIYE